MDLSFFVPAFLTPCRSGCRSFFTEKRIFLFLCARLCAPAYSPEGVVLGAVSPLSMLSILRTWCALRRAPGLVVKNDVAAGEAAACGIDVIDSDRKRIGAIIHIHDESAHPASNLHRPGKVRMITANCEALEFSISKADASRRIAVHAVALDTRGKSTRMCCVKIEGGLAAAHCDGAYPIRF